MKLSNAYVVSGLASIRDKLVQQRDRGTVAVLVDGEKLDGAAVAAVRQVLRRVFDERIEVLDGELRDLGVEVEPELT